MAIVLPEWANGPWDVGIAAGTDSMHESTKKLKFTGGAEIVPDCQIYAMQRVYIDPRWNIRVKALMVQAASLIISKGMYDESQGIVINDAGATATTCTPAEINAWIPQGFTQVDIGTIILATKITFVMINHHVGQNADQSIIDGYIGKVCRAKGWMELEGLKTAIWIIGHWCDTKLVLNELGYPDIDFGGNRAPAKVWNLVISDDMRLRISGGVAGAAKFLVGHAILNLLIKTPYSLLCSIEAHPDEIIALHADIKAHPLRYHVGSMFLTGQAQRKSDLFTEADRITLSSYIRVAAPDGTLSKSPSIIPRGDLDASEVYQKFMNLKINLVGVNTVAVALQVAKKAGLASSSLGVVSGFATMEEVEKATLEVEAEAEEKRKKGTATVSSGKS